MLQIVNTAVQYKYNNKSHMRLKHVSCYAVPAAPLGPGVQRPVDIWLQHLEHLR